jgi:hypothetical protein
MSNIEDLKRLVLNDSFEKEDHEHVYEIEKQLHKALVAEKLVEHEIIKEFVEYLENRVERAEVLLKTDRTITERERDAIFERIDVCNHFLSILTGKERENIETQINKMYDAAKNL